MKKKQPSCWFIRFKLKMPSIIFAYNVISNSCPQPKDGGDATEESHKQAVRKRRVRKDWGGEPHAYCLLSPPDAEEVERLCLLPPSHWVEQHIVPPDHPPIFPLIMDPQSTKSASCITPYLVPSPSPISSFNIRWIPWRVCAFSCFSSSIQNFHTFLIPLLFSCLSAYEAASVPVHLPVSAVCFLSEYTPSYIHQSEGERSTECALLSPLGVCTILQHIKGASSQKLLFFFFFSRKCSRIVWQSPFLVWQTGHQAVRTGCLRCPCRVRTFQMMGCLSLQLKVYLFKKYLGFRQVVRSISHFSVCFY